MLDHNCWRELSCLVDVFRRVGKMGGKASLTTSTEDGHWRASLDIQTNLPTAAHPGQASAPTPYSAAPGQDGAAARRRPRRRRGPASAMRSKARAAAHQATLVAPTGGTGSVPPPCQAQAACLQAAGTEEATAVLTPCLNMLCQWNLCLCGSFPADCLLLYLCE